MTPEHQEAPAAAPAHPALTLRLLQPGDHARWDAFVLACPQATFFHRAGWQRVLEDGLGHATWFMYAEADGVIEAVLPLCQVNSRLFGNSLCSLPFCVYGGIAANHDRAAALLDQAAQTLAAQLGVDHLEYRNVAGRHPDWLRQSLYATFRKPLHPLAEQNLLEIPRKQRAMVRKGIAAGLVSRADNNLAHFFHAYARSVHRLGTPVFSRRYFALLRAVFGADCEIINIYRPHGASEDIVAGVMVFYFRNEVLPYYGGGTEAARTLAGNDFMYWEVMRRACERGCHLFDFGRSKRGTGAFDFKKNWGFPAATLDYEVQLHRAIVMPDVNPLNPKYRRFIQAWRRLPLPLANWLGPHIVRQLG